MPRLPALVHRLRFLLLLLIATAIALAVWMLSQKAGRPDPLLDTPQIALESLQAKSLYFNGRARPWLLTQRPDLLTSEERNDPSERTRTFSQAVQNPNLFRQLDRQSHFDALLFVGDPSEYKPLLDHLLDRKDWTLRYADHTSLVFRRDEGPAWTVADFAKVRARFADAGKSEQATVLAQTGTKLLSAGQAEAGRKLLDEATQLAPRNPVAANGLAVYHLNRGEWREAAEQVERALSADGKYLPALATKTQLLYGTKRFSEAYDLSQQLVKEWPNDAVLLFYHAKIAHEAHAYKAEIATLETLIAQADAAEQPTGGYLLYLGQSYAALGDAPGSIDAFMRALNDPDLPDDQRSFARENILRIKKRTGL